VCVGINESLAREISSMHFRLEEAEARVKNLESRADRPRRRVPSWLSRNTEASRGSRDNGSLLDNRPCPPSTTTTSSHRPHNFLQNDRDRGRSDSSSHSSTIRPEDSASVQSDPNRWRQPHYNREQHPQCHIRGRDDSRSMDSKYSESSLYKENRLRGRPRDPPRYNLPHGESTPNYERSHRQRTSRTCDSEDSQPARIATNTSSSQYTSPVRTSRTRSSSASGRGERHRERRKHDSSSRREIPFARVWRKHKISSGESQTTFTGSIPSSVSTTPRNRRGSF
jgi:hypothetical protein